MPNIKPIKNGLFETYTYRDMLGIYEVLDTLGVGHEKYTDKNVAYNVKRDAFHVMYASCNFKQLNL